MESIKLVVVGNGGVGKTSLLMTFTSGRYPLDYTPSEFDNNTAIIMVNDERVKIDLWDSPELKEFDSLIRSAIYSSTDILLLCFSISCEWSFKEIKNKWIPEVTHYCPNTPFIIVGTKLDLRDDEITIKQAANYCRSIVSCEQGKELAKEVNAIDYLECSSRTGKGVKSVFEHATRIVLNRQVSNTHRKG